MTSDQNKLLSLAAYYQSPAAYCFIRRQFCLPSYETLRSFVSSVTVRTGFRSELTEALRLRAKSLSQKERYVVILFDGMALQSCTPTLRTKLVALLSCVILLQRQQMLPKLLFSSSTSFREIWVQIFPLKNGIS